MSDDAPQIPTDPAEIAKMLVSTYQALLQAIDVVPLPSGFADEPAPSFRVIKQGVRGSSTANAVRSPGVTA